jgi:hypothetical protein
VILIALRNQWPDRVVSWDHTGPVPDNHVEFESLAALDAWKEAHPELAPQPEPAPDPVPDEVAMLMPSTLRSACCLNRSRPLRAIAGTTRTPSRVARLISLPCSSCCLGITLTLTVCSNQQVNYNYDSTKI